MLYPEWVHYIRKKDFESFREEIDKHVDASAPHAILEVGGGDGYFAGLFIEAGYNVCCTDPKPRSPGYCKVELVDAASLPFAKGEFNVIFSSNVIEHIEDLSSAFSEMRRVLRPGGVMLHCVPTPACSLLTTVTAPLSYLRVFYLIASGLLFEDRDLSKPLLTGPLAARWIYRRRRLGRWFNRMLISLYCLHPRFICRFGVGHGVARGPIDELVRWRDTRWRGIFQASNLDVASVRPGDLLYSMNKLLPQRWVRLRAFLARKGLPADRFYVLTKCPAPPPSAETSESSPCTEGVAPEAAADGPPA